MTIRAMEEVKAPMAARRRNAESTPAIPTKTGYRVLVVEDEQDVAELLRYNLAKEGYDVVLVANGTEALRRAREVKPQVILLDIMVPQLPMPGIETVRGVAYRFREPEAGRGFGRN